MKKKQSVVRVYDLGQVRSLLLFLGTIAHFRFPGPIFNLNGGFYRSHDFNPLFPTD